MSVGKLNERILNMAKSAKGSEYERTISKKLSLWFSEGQRDDIFWRTSQSGGRATIRHRAGKSTANADGDIAAVDESGKSFIRHYLVEIKRGYTKQLDILNFVDSKSDSILFKWTRKARHECHRAGRQTILIIIKRDRKEPFVIITKNHFNELVSHFGEFPGRFIRLGERQSRSVYVLIKLDAYLNWIDPRWFDDK
jgi:hypothetical protein